MSKNKNGKPGGFKVPESAKKLANLNFKKFKKANKNYYDGKKELMKAYFAQIIELLGEPIVLITRYGHLNEMKEIKMAIYEKMTDPDFIKYFKKEIKSDLELDNLELVPYLINDMVRIASEQVAEDKATEGVDTEYDMTDLIEVSQLILKKRLKKMEKANVNAKLAFDVLSTIPDPSLLKRNQNHHIRKLFNVLYEHAKTVEVPFEKIIKIVLKGGEEDYTASIITFALLERKVKIANFTDSQRKLFNDITEWLFKTMEEMSREEIVNILRNYAEIRKRDAAQNNDDNRRFYISSLPSEDYPKILRAVERVVERDETLKKFF